LRRRVAIECVVHSNYWDGGVPFAASDLSDEGVWIDTSLILDAGEDLILSFAPPGSRRANVWVEAQVARVGLARRRCDLEPMGMGVSFTYLSDRDRALLARALLGHPPRLPHARRRPPPLPKQRSVEFERPFVERLLPAVLDADLAGSFAVRGMLRREARNAVSRSQLSV
jgi:hypothetical protein